MLDDLNEAQQRAVKIKNGPILILAGAGSGKTRTIAHRIAYLLDSGLSASEILGLTFTNKAAAELRERVNQLLGDGGLGKKLWISTFHSMALRLLRANSLQSGLLPNFSICDKSDSMKLLKAIIAERLDGNRDLLDPKKILTFISRNKSNMVMPDIDNVRYNDPKREYWEIYESYESKLNELNSVDFDSILIKLYNLLTDQPDIRKSYQLLFKHILVDEFQDTNTVQYMILKLFLNDEQNICVVGDDDQSIYGWRGANINNILNFEKDFRSVQIIKLAQNYRSCKNILQAANEVVKCNSERKAKELFTDNEVGEKVDLYEANDEYAEARWVSSQIRKALLNDKIKLSDIAIIYRTNSQSRPLEHILRAEGFKYQLLGGLKFYDRMEVKDIVAYLKVAINYNDEVSFYRIINSPQRGIGKVLQGKIESYALANNMTSLDVLLKSGGNDWFTTSEQSRLSEARLIFEQLILLTEDNRKDPSTIIEETVRIVQYEEWLRTKYSMEHSSKLENIGGLIDEANNFANNIDLEEESNSLIGSFLDQASLLSGIDFDQSFDDHIKLMTVHVSKGLEFEHVFLTGVEDGIFPHIMATNSQREIDEERRLMYVAMTRAKNRLSISYARSRFKFGKSATPTGKSAFISHIPLELVDSENVMPDSIETKFESRNLHKRYIRPYNRPDYFEEEQELKPKVTNSKQKPFNANLKADQLHRGDYVIHPKFQSGKIMDISGVGDQAKVVVYFPPYGDKKLILKYANLVKAK
ncbi:MAG: ATP-dependent helicase [Nitrospinota bacterium]